MRDSIKAVDVASLIAPVISSRDIVHIIAEEANSTDAKSVKLDFSHVEFISRSAAHELLQLKEDLQRKWYKKKTISFVNTNQDVTEMLRLVAANRAVPSPSPRVELEEIDILSLSRESEL